VIDAESLPLIFASLLGLSILLYVVLDGFDLGVGLLLPFAESNQRDRRVASIGPFWDANETWLVLAIGILLVAFPAAHGQILTALYLPDLPVAIMLIGLILRGVAFEFRAKAPLPHKDRWDRIFFAGSLTTSLSQGLMLGLYVMGLKWGLAEVAFAALTSLALSAAYGFIGAAWLIIKTDGALQLKAVAWARRGIWGLVLGMAAVSLATPLVSPRIFAKWFSFPEIVLLVPLPVMSALLIVLVWIALKRLPTRDDSFAWFPFAAATLLMALGFCGMAYSFYPFIVPQRLTIAAAASSPESLRIILFGVVCVLPVILAYTVFAYAIFRGKATGLSYD